MDFIEFRVIRNNSEMSFRALMAQTLKRLGSISIQDAKEKRRQIEEELFAFLQNLPPGKYRIGKAGIKQVSPNANPEDKHNIWWKNHIPAWFKRDSEILKTIQAESPENLQ